MSENKAFFLSAVMITIIAGILIIGSVIQIPIEIGRIANHTKVERLK